MQTITSEPIRIIAGSGRSGTTWVLDVLADANELRPVFEPLHPLAVPAARPFAYRYLRPGDADDAAVAFLAPFFDANFHSWWTSYRVRPDRLLPRVSLLGSLSQLRNYVRRWQRLYDRRRSYAPVSRRNRTLVKFIRANLMLEWISEHFNARIVFVLRHPGAVIESRLRIGGDDWDPYVQLRSYLAQPQLQEDYLLKYNDLLRGPLSKAEAHAAVWCIENQLPLRQLSSGHATIAYYEHLLTGGSEPWLAVLKTLDLRHMPADSLLSRPSESAGTAVRKAFDAVDGQRWHERLDPATRNQIAAVLHAMEVSIYDVDDPLPRTANRGDGPRHTSDPMG